MEFRSNFESPHIGDIYYIRFDGGKNEQHGWRPGLVFQNNLGNKFSPNIIALPITSKIKKLSQPTHVVLPKDIGLKEDSMVLCENPERISKDRLGKYLISVPDEYMSKIAVANLLASSAISFIDFSVLLETWQQANALNSKNS